MNIDQKQPDSALKSPVKRNSLVRFFSIFLMTAPLFYLLFLKDFTAVQWTNDTVAFIEFHPYRQPLYGHFYNVLASAGLNLPEIALIQVFLLIFSTIFLANEILTTRISAWAFSALAMVFWFPSVMYFFPLATTFIAEALFYPLLICLCALVTRFMRTGQGAWLYLSVVCGFLLVLTRGAALVFLPSMFLVFVLVILFGGSIAKSISIRSLVLLVLLMVLVPVTLGRGIAEIGTEMDRKGFAFISRVVQVPASLEIGEPANRKWLEMNKSYVSAGNSLSCAERSMFDSQLQEAVRFYIAPIMFFNNPDVWSVSDVNLLETERSWSHAFNVFMGAVKQEPLSYLKISACHFWGMASAGTHMGSDSRKRVFQALQNEVDPYTWEIARFRTDYPLTRYDIPLKPHTELIYFGFRLISLAGTILGLLVSAVLLINAVKGKRPLDCLATGWLFLTSSLYAHSLLIALSIFPDPRFVMLNFIILWTILALGVAQFGSAMTTRKWIE